MDYFHSIYQKKIIYGQFTNVGAGLGQYTGVDADRSASGKFPAMISLDLYGFASPHWSEQYRSVVRKNIDGAVEWWQKRHGIVTMQYHWGNPLCKDGTAWVNHPAGSPRVDISRLITPGTSENSAAMSDLRRTADAMQKLSDNHVPVLFRPLHEIDGGWFWWADRKRPENSANLWRMIYKYMVNQRGYHNLVWVYSIGDTRDTKEYRSKFYPGDEYVDIVGADIYSNQVHRDYHQDAYRNFYDLLADLAPTKMIALCECDAVPNPSTMSSSGPRWLYALAWWKPGQENPVDWVKQVMTHPLVITLEGLPINLFN